jgi:acetyl esterase/lipase
LLSVVIASEEIYQQLLQILLKTETLRKFVSSYYSTNIGGYFLTKRTMEWFRDCYLDSEEDKQNPVVSPFLYEDFKGLPPACYYR